MKRTDPFSLGEVFFIIFQCVLFTSFVTFTVMSINATDNYRETVNSICKSLSGSSEGQVREWNGTLYCLDARGDIQYEASLHFRGYRED